MKNSKYIFTFLLLSLTYLAIFTTALFAQTKSEYFPDPFHSITAGGLKKIVLVQSELTKIECYGEDCKLEFSVNNGELEIAKSKNLLKVEMIKIYSPTFNMLNFSGGTEIKAETIIKSDSFLIFCSGATEMEMTVDCRKLSLKLSGASEVTLSGNTKELIINSSGASEINAYKLSTENSIIHASGASDIKVNADSSIVAKLSGASSLKYEKEPAHKEIDMNNSPITAEELQIDIIKDSLILKFDDENLVLNDSSFNFDFPKKKKREEFKGNWSGLEFGINGFLTPSNSTVMPAGYEFLELKNPRSNNFNFNFMQQSIGIIGNKVGLVTGMGFHWNNYRFEKNMELRNDSNVIAGSYDNSTTINYKKSKLTVAYITIPLLLEFQTNNDHNLNSFHLSAGVIGGIKIGSHTKQEYTSVDGTSKPRVYDDFFLNPYKLDATTRIGWGKLNIYATYSLIEMFRKNRGPELYPFTFGLILPLS